MGSEIQVPGCIQSSISSQRATLYTDLNAQQQLPKKKRKLVTLGME